MTNEEYQRIKEAEKAHLRQIRELKGKLKSAQQFVKVKGALNEMESGVAAVSHTHEEMLDKIRQENALTEAKMEIAMENVPLQAQPTLSDEEIQKQNAASLLAQFKAEMGILKTDTPAKEETKSIGKTPVKQPTQVENSRLPERTIGKPRG